MSSMIRKLRDRKYVLSHLALILGAFMALWLVVGVAALAFNLNQTVPSVTVTISPPPGGGGGGSPPPGAAALYSDSTTTAVLGSLSFAYATGGNQSVTAYAKTAETLDWAGVIVTPGGGLLDVPGGLSLSAVMGDDTSGVRPVVITASGGAAGAYSGSATFPSTP